MAESVYRVTEVIGVSSESWEAAARAAVETAAKTVRDLRVAEVIRQDVTIEDGTPMVYGFQPYDAGGETRVLVVPAPSRTRSCFAARSRRSMRAAIVACSVAGTLTSDTRALER